MAYTHDIWYFRNSTEHEFKFKGRCGAKGEKRLKKKKATPEQIRKQNQINRQNQIRRTIKANFEPKDMWCCLKYPAGTRPSVEIVKEDKERFLRYLRTQYRKRGSPMKWVARMEVGKHGGVHMHILLNRIPMEQTDILIEEAWSKALKKSKAGKQIRTDGLVDYRTTYDAGGFKQLAEYICKEPKEGTEEYEQLSLFPKEEQKALVSVTTSRNLIRPEPEHHEYKTRTMRKLIEDGPEPSPGYYIDMDTLYIGVNPYNGYSYCKYTEIRLPETGINTKCEGHFERKKRKKQKKRRSKVPKSRINASTEGDFK